MKSEFIPVRLKRCTKGVNTELGVIECWIALFLENEKRHARGGKPLPRTNPEITKFMINEFPKKDSAIYRYPNKAMYRYNRGLMYTGMKKPKIKAYRYDSKGRRVPPRYFDPLTD